MTGGCFSSIMGVVWHLAKRAIFPVITFILAIYATVVIANGGGRVDQILKDQIYTDLKQQYARNPAFQRLPPQEQARQFNISYNSIIEAQGLNEPFFQKSFRYTFNALQLNLGRATQLHSSDLSMRVSDIIFERLPRSLVLFTVANVVAAVFGIWLGLWMARKALSAFDRGMTVLSVTTFVVPPWVYGILFILIFAYVFKVFPAGGLTSVPPLPPSPLILAFPPLIAAGLAADRHVARVDPRRGVDGCDHHGDRLPISGARPAILRGHFPVRRACRHRPHDGLRAPPRGHRILAGRHVQSPGSANQGLEEVALWRSPHRSASKPRSLRPRGRRADWRPRRCWGSSSCWQCWSPCSCRLTSSVNGAIQDNGRTIRNSCPPSGPRYSRESASHARSSSHPRGNPAASTTSAFPSRSRDRTTRS